MRLLEGPLLFAALASPAFASNQERDLFFERAGRAAEEGLVTRGKVDALQALYYTAEVDGVLRTFQVFGAKDIQACCPGCVSYDSKHFYNGPRSMNRALVLGCLENRKMHAAREISGSSPELCVAHRFWFDKVYDTYAHYIVSKEPDGMHITQNVRFDIQACCDISESSMISAIEECVPKIRSFWARYGIVYNLIFDTKKSPLKKKPFFTMTVTADKGHSDAATLHFLDSGKQESASQRDTFCKVLLHELGHRLSLDDQYPDKNCPDREHIDDRGPPFNVMSHHRHAWDELELTPADIIKVIRPFCP